MKILHSKIILTLFWIIHAFFLHKAYSQTCYSQIFPHEMLSYEKSQVEINLLYTALQKIHPGLHEFITADSLQNEYQEIMKNLSAPIPTYDFYVTLRKFIARIKDGHTVILPPQKITKEIIKKGRFIPFTIKFYQQKVYIDQYFAEDGRLQKGYQVLQINSLPLDTFLQELIPQMPADGENIGFQLSSIEPFFPFYLAEKIGFPDSIKIYYQNENGGPIYAHKIPLLKWEYIQKQLRKSSPLSRLKKNPIQLEWLQDSTFALLRINSFYGNSLPGSFNKMLQRKMKEITRRSPQALILDLRENGGGQILLSMKLFSYFCDSLFPLVNYTQINQKQFTIQAQDPKNRKTQTYKFKPFGWFNSLWIEKKQANSYFQIRPALTYNLPAKKYCYKGKFYILCGPNTFSSAAFFCSLARQYTQAILVGEETGGGYYGTSAGTWVKLVLPYSKITVHIPTILFRLNVSGVPFGKGVPPHIIYIPTFEDKLGGKDSVLEFILRNHTQLSR